MKTINIEAQDLQTWKLNEIASLLNPEQIHYNAMPYWKAMRMMSSLDDSYGADSAASIVTYFLSNATHIKGEIARAVKKELNRRLKEYHGKK